MRVSSIKKNDTVIAVAGAQRGKTGKVLQVLPAEQRVLVEGLNLRKKTLRKSEENPQGGIVDREFPIAISNVQLYCSNCKKGVRVGRERAGDSVTRKCKACGHALEG